MITNFKNLARNSLRKKALLIAEAGYEAIDIEKVIQKKIIIRRNRLTINLASINGSKKLELNLDNYQRIFLVGIGKGSALACASLVKILGEKLTKGIALDVKNLKSQISNLKIFVGTHPLPSPKNINATQQIIKLAKSLKKDDLLITFICGGGSALLCGSKTELNASRIIFKELTKKGADIFELNTIRKHLSEINPHTKRGATPSAQKDNSPRYGVWVKGGNFAKLVYPATVISLIVSDVIGNNLSIVASGPTVYDKTTKKDAEKILKKYQHKSASLSALISVLKETPKDKKYFKKVKNVLFLSNREPILAMLEKAKKLGFKVKIHSLKIQGEAKNALLPLMEVMKNNQVLLAGGETTVTMNNELGIKNYELGKGGRNTEAVLGVLNPIYNSLFIIHNSVILTFASDGRDNTEAAGAIADFLTVEIAKKMKLESQKFLDSHNSFNFFQKTDDLIFTEPKTFNVSDLMIILRSNH